MSNSENRFRIAALCETVCVAEGIAECRISATVARSPLCIWFCWGTIYSSELRHL